MPADRSTCLERLNLAPQATALLALVSDQPSETAYRVAALSAARERLAADFVALAEGEAGRWTPLGQNGPRQELPSDLLADALDRLAPVSSPGWLAAPLASSPDDARVLVAARAGKRGDAAALQLLDALAAALALGSALAVERSQSQRRINRMEAILQIVAHWNQAQETAPLLELMAAAATRLLDCERATIFLWDRAARQLVGRPALGLPSGELRIADHVGLVGRVIASGNAERVAAEQGAQQIDHSVDARTGFVTRNLLCVPLRGRGGELFGAFEVINRREGDFTDDDAAALGELAAHAGVALENTGERERLFQTQRQHSEDAIAAAQLIGNSPAIEALRSTVQRVAATDLAVLILGDNGTGKEVVSRLIHLLGPRRDRPFIAVNCAAIAESLLESELFGHERGAFTDARESRAGKFELANGGTLFLDEIGDLSLAGQAKLLRVLEEKLVVRVGGSTPIHTDARVVAATNQDLAELVRRKRFREDLFFRLSVVSLQLPPLRARGDDALILAEHFLRDFARKARRPALKLTAAARKRLVAHDWPGNVRELRNLMERLAYLQAGEKIEAEDLTFLLTGGGHDAAEHVPLGLPLAEATDAFQTNYIRQTIEQARSHMTDAAQRLGLHRSNLYRKMRQLGMVLPED
ncbi:MAG: sigma-54-dependent Fis family transcriptional regulator [Pirellulales bacterium]